jgi:hydroxyacylglutathione hydrolase
MTMKLTTLRHGDNYIYLLVKDQLAVVVDPGTADPVLNFLKAHDITLEHMLLTHYHADHTAGCKALKQASACRVAGPGGNTMPLDDVITDGTILRIAGMAITVLSVPGHTAFDVAYYLPEERILFSGDTLFSGGCGRLFTGNAAQMWSSLCRLRELPDDTRVCGGHDYTLDNLRFAAHIEPQNGAIQTRLGEHETAGEAATPRVSTIGEERQTNPFFRCDTPALVAALNLPATSSPDAVFAKLRRQKDHW